MGDSLKKISRYQVDVNLSQNFVLALVMERCWTHVDYSWRTPQWVVLAIMNQIHFLFLHQQNETLWNLEDNHNSQRHVELDRLLDQSFHIRDYYILERSCSQRLLCLSREYSDRRVTCNSQYEFHQWELVQGLWAPLWAQLCRLLMFGNSMKQRKHSNRLHCCLDNTLFHQLWCHARDKTIPNRHLRSIVHIGVKKWDTLREIMARYCCMKIECLPFFLTAG